MTTPRQVAPTNRTSRLLTACAAVAAAAVSATVLIHARSADAQQPTGKIAVDWQNPEIKRFVDQRRANPSANIVAGIDASATRLQLPMVGFDRRPPSLAAAAASAGVSANSEVDRQVILDTDNPVWYQITEAHGDVTITIEGDLRLQGTIEKSKIFTPTPGAGQSGPINIIDGTVEPGMKGAIAEFTVYRYPNIPYRVVIECGERSREYCRNRDAIARDRDALKLIEARPPQ